MRSGRQHPGTRARRRGFTLAEMLVAVAAMLLIAVGLAQIFTATGNTVTTGKRVSYLREYAGMIEQQLRADISRMTRDGFLVIRHELNFGPGGTATNGTIASHPDQPDRFRRARRTDEIVFFAAGEFASRRDPVHPDRVPTATEARIYYGHGMRHDPDAAYFDAPVRLDTSNWTTLPDYFGFDGPNEFAADWTLLRHAALLRAPGSTSMDDLSYSFPGVSFNQLRDSAIQIGLQPAASSVFRTEAQFTPDPLPGNIVRNTVEHPLFISGAVDIAATNLSDVRRLILSAPDDPAGLGAADFPLQLSGQFDAGEAETLFNMQAWMRDALPAPSDNTNPPERMRAEPTPPNPLASGAGFSTIPLQNFIQRTDQAVLSAFNFVPHCTEFIVEWTFGDRYEQGDLFPFGRSVGELIWHGLPREVNLEPGVPTNTFLAADEYDNNPNNPRFPHVTRYRRLDGTTQQWQIPFELIHGDGIIDDNINSRQFLYSYFGIVDPTFDGNDDNDPATIPWAWPRLIRITMTLADPNDPAIEQTFQFTFEVPGAPEPGA